MILANTGSVGLALIYWVIGFIMAVAGFSVYLEFASYFPNRSGSEVVYLEQAYPRPKHLFPVAFAVQSVILSFSSSNAIGEPPNSESHLVPPCPCGRFAMLGLQANSRQCCPGTCGALRKRSLPTGK